MAESSQKASSDPPEFRGEPLFSTPMNKQFHFSPILPKITEQQLQNFCVSKVCRRNRDKLISLDFNSNGEQVVACCADNLLFIYSCYEGTITGQLSLRKFGVDIVKWGREYDNVIHSSKNLDYHIRYLAFHRAQYITFLKGHRQKVLSLSLSTNNQLVSGSRDQSIRLWDLRSPDCIDIKYFPGETICSFHPQGILLATGIGSRTVACHDTRFFVKPFKTFNIEGEGHWGGLKFSNDGELLLISTNNSRSYLTDPIRGSVIHIFEDYDNTNALPLEASFTPDSQFVLIGSEDGKVHIWNAKSGKKVVVLNQEQVNSITCLQFSPKYMSFVTASTNMAFWEPRISNCPSFK